RHRSRRFGLCRRARWFGRPPDPLRPGQPQRRRLRRTPHREGLTMQILTNLEGSVLRLQINRPEKRNALTLGMYEQMTSALQEADRDPTVRVVLIHGQPDSFTSGNDLQD